ncbi:hypothetical protein ACFLV2_02265 [Chloroflexota bacterium]
MRNRSNVLVKDKEKQEEALTDCHHYWIIEGANGQTSLGVCKNCGTEKLFSNSIIQVSNVLKRNPNPLELPEMPDVDFDEDENKQ